MHDGRAGTAQLEASEIRLQEAEASGHLMINVPTEDIDSAAMVRNRTELDADEMIELRSSIPSNGQRLPIEFFEKSDVTGQGKSFGLISGFRRLMAVRELHGLSNDDQFLTVRAIVRPKSDADAAFVGMVEENEVRSELSQFELGCMAVISAQQGAFLNVEEAENKLFATGSKAK